MKRIFMFTAGIALVLISALIISVAVYITASELIFMSHSERTEAVAEGFCEQAGDDYIAVSYKYNRGKYERVIELYDHNPRGIKTGDSITVYHDLEQPGDVRILTVKLPVVTAAAGTVSVLPGILLINFSKRSKEKVK